MTRILSPRSIVADPYDPSAEFSDDLRFRWILRWHTGAGAYGSEPDVPAPGDLHSIMAVCGANPSVAGQLRPDGTLRSDPTVTRMRSLARDLGYGWLWMVNVRSFVATDPKLVPADPEAIGTETDLYIRLAAERSSLFVCAWGHLAGERGPRVLDLVRAAGKLPHALALTADGTPRHPRGLSASVRPFPLNTP